MNDPSSDPQRQPQPPPLPMAAVNPPAPLFEMETPPAPVLPRLGFAKSLALCGVWIVISVTLSLVFWALQELKVINLDMFASLFIQQVIAWPITLWLGLWWGGIKVAEAFPLKSFPAKIVVPILVLGVGLEIILTGVSSLIPMPEFIKNYIVGQVQQSHWALIGLAVVVAAPIWEELFFRGLLLRGYRARYSVSASIWLTAILFALFHMNPWQAIVALPMGVICAWLAVRTDSLLPAMLMHFSINLTGTALMSQIGGLMGYSKEAWEALDQLPPSLLGIGAVLAVAAGGLLWRQLTAAPAPVCDAVIADEA